MLSSFFLFLSSFSFLSHLISFMLNTKCIKAENEKRIESKEHMTRKEEKKDCAHCKNDDASCGKGEKLHFLECFPLLCVFRKLEFILFLFPPLAAYCTYTSFRLPEVLSAYLLGKKYTTIVTCHMFRALHISHNVSKDYALNARERFSVVTTLEKCR